MGSNISNMQQENSRLCRSAVLLSPESSRDCLSHESEQRVPSLENRLFGFDEDRTICYSEFQKVRKS